MLHRPLISVVVPVYKVQKYLDRCLESIVNQTYSALEIILVDDGSPDCCPEICEKWAERDKRIRVIHKENEGLGMARNTGLDHAGGEFVCFVDSDDYILPGMMEALADTARREAADICLCGFLDENSAGERRQILFAPVQNSYCGDEIRTLFFPEFLGLNPRTGEKSGMLGSACACLISMDLVRKSHWRFVSEREFLSEDLYSMLQLCRNAERISIIRESYYCYCRNPGSLSRSYREDRFEKGKHLYRKCLELCSACDCPPLVQKQCGELFMSVSISAMKQIVAQFPRRKDALARIREIVDDALTRQILEEKRNDPMGLRRKMLFWAMGHKYYRLCALLLHAQNLVKAYDR